MLVKAAKMVVNPQLRARASKAMVLRGMVKPMDKVVLLEIARITAKARASRAVVNQTTVPVISRATGKMGRAMDSQVLC